MLITCNPMRYGERLKLAMERAKLKQYQLAEKAGIKQPSLSHLINDPNVTGSEFTVQFANACGVSPEWLAMEQGEMVGQPTLIAQPQAAYQAKDPLLDDLAALDKFEADAYMTRLKRLRSQIEETEADIRLAADKARTKEKSDRQAASGPGDPHSEDRRTA